jgi:predicted component of type VI protein secretion system
MASGEKQIVIWDTVDITVGRSENQDIVVADAEVSREHAVFRRRGDVCEVEDLRSGLGTIVDGKAVKVHGLKHGDVIRIGTLSIAFGLSPEPIPRAKNVRFASELKGFGLCALDDAAGRTMLGFDAEDDLRPAPSASQSAKPRAVTADGTLEIDSNGLSAFDLGAAPADVRDLDLDLAEHLPAPAPTSDASAGAEATATTAPTAPGLGEPAHKPSETATLAPVEPLATTPERAQSEASAKRTAPIEPTATESRRAPSDGAAAAITTKLVLEVRGPAAAVEAFLELVRDKRIELPPIELLIRDI